MDKMTWSQNHRYEREGILLKGYFIPNVKDSKFAKVGFKLLTTYTYDSL